MGTEGQEQIDPILVEVIGSRLQTVAREMLFSLIRAAYSTNIKERFDCGTGIFNIDGDQVVLAHQIDEGGQVVLGLESGIEAELLQHGMLHIERHLAP